MCCSSVVGASAWVCDRTTWRYHVAAPPGFPMLADVQELPFPATGAAGGAADYRARDTVIGHFPLRSVALPMRYA